MCIASSIGVAIIYKTNSKAGTIQIQGSSHTLQLTWNTMLHSMPVSYWAVAQ